MIRYAFLFGKLERSKSLPGDELNVSGPSGCCKLRYCRLRRRSAGMIAAASAACLGCSVSIIEHFGFFGGAAAACLVVPISGFFKNGERVIGGLPWEFMTEWIGLGAIRLIFADERAHASIRVQGTCMATGQAASVAAAIALREHAGVQAIDVRDLRTTLQSPGGIC